MTKSQISLFAMLKRLGLTQGNQMKLYGQECELLSEPIVLGNSLVICRVTGLCDSCHRSSKELLQL